MIGRLNALLLSALLMSLPAPSAWALSWTAAVMQEPTGTPQQPPQDPGYTAEEAAAYNAFVTAPSLAEKIKLAEQFLATYPNSKLGQNASKSLVTFYVQNNDLDKGFSHGMTHLTKYPGELLVALILADTASRQAKTGKHTYDEQGLKCAELVIASIEKGETIPGLPADQWNTQKNQFLGSMHQAAGLFLKSKGDSAAAAEHLLKAGALDASDPVTFYLLADALVNGAYAQVRKRYDDLPDKTTDEAKALLAEADQIVDRIIAAYAQTIAIGGTDQTFQGLVAATRPNLEKFYKYRHNDSLDGLQELIEKYKPVAGNQPPAKSS
ncbi:MAG: hypothetical protein HY650_09950 [Acidobacteria bacterium]|nr:hypothetical protein [Acidobacteriota bacterium]